MKLPLPTNSSHKKRLSEWESWLRNFYNDVYKTTNQLDFTYIPNAAWLLNDLYWRITEQYIRPILKKTTGKVDKQAAIHPYKIASASEITIMMTEPIQIPNNPEIEKKYNALFAWFVATEIIGGWYTGSPVKISASQINTIAGCKEHITRKKFYPETLAYEHINWLINLNTTIEKPLFLNAQFWRLFYLCCINLSEHSKSNNS